MLLVFYRALRPFTPSFKLMLVLKTVTDWRPEGKVECLVFTGNRYLYVNFRLGVKRPLLEKKVSIHIFVH